MKRWFPVLMAVILSLFVFSGCGSKEVGPTVYIWPQSSGIVVSEGYGLSFNGEAVIDNLPDDYHIPQNIFIYKIGDVGKVYTVLLGKTDLPSPKNSIKIPLTEEIKVTLKEQGLTQILFE